MDSKPVQNWTPHVFGIRPDLLHFPVHMSRPEMGDVTGAVGGRVATSCPGMCPDAGGDAHGRRNPSAGYCSAVNSRTYLSTLVLSCHVWH